MASRRRKTISTSSFLLRLVAFRPVPSLDGENETVADHMISIRDISLRFSREPLLKPFGFKGGSLTELWQIAAGLADSEGSAANGRGVQSVLWSDAAVFSRQSEAGGNAMMLLLTDHALRLIRGRDFADPLEMLDDIFPAVLERGREITGLAGLRATFALNALVAVDAAAWILRARALGTESFEEVLPEEFRPVLAGRQKRLAKVPLIAYGTSDQEIDSLAASGCFFLKIKIGSDPHGDGNREAMLAWDKERLSRIHERLRDHSFAETANGKVAYYLDGNGRYDSVDRVLRLLDHAEKIGALECVHLLEEPFSEEFTEDVSAIPVRVAADESAHTEADAVARMEQGYGAVALKPIAKTVSMSLRVARAARQRGIPCFCADLTVNPLMVEWNKNFAARLEPLPGLSVGVVETNGAQNYRNWEAMVSGHPLAAEPWVRGTAAAFDLPDAFYQTSGGIFRTETTELASIGGSHG